MLTYITPAARCSMGAVRQRGGINHSPPYAATIPANGYRFQAPTTLATSDGSRSAQGTPRDAVPRATMNGQRYFPAARLAENGWGLGQWFF